MNIKLSQRLLLIFLIVYPIQYAFSSSLTEREDIISTRVKEFIMSNINDSAKIWVFFIDKGGMHKENYRSGAIEINEHTQKRRLKHGINTIVFTDLPLNADYIDQIINTGAELKRKSRW
ncbi:MAG: hypothetical protein GY853_10335, partial [PVC group bacterium]|nr:hypothetical protein [PVC group bacterium]